MMKGDVVSNGYMGCVDGTYILFESEADYLDYISE